MEKIIEYQNKVYKVCCREDNYRSVSHTEWAYILYEQRTVIRKLWFRQPVTKMKWVKIDESYHDSGPHSVEAFMTQAKNLITNYYRHLDIIKKRAMAIQKFDDDFKSWDGVIR